MKNFKIYFLIAIVIGSHQLVAQNKSFGIGTATPNPNAVLHLVSPTNNQGLQLPPLTTAQRTNMTLAAADKGLTVFDSDLSTFFSWDGTSWGVPVYAQNLTATGNAGTFVINNASSMGNAIFATSNSSNDRPVVYSTHTGTGSGAGAFKIANATNGFAGVYGETIGTGSAGYFKVINPSNTFAGVIGETNGSGAAVFGSQLGLGRAGQFQITNATNSDIALRGYTNGTGMASKITIDNVANSSPALLVESNGTGPTITGNSSGSGSAGYFERSAGGTGPNAALGSVSLISTAGAGYFKISNAGNSQSTLYAETNGTGAAVFGYSTGTQQAGYFQNNNSSSSAPALFVTSNTTTNGAYFENTNTSSNGAAVYGVSTSTALTSYAGNFRNTSAASIGGALYAVTYGTGSTAVINHRGSSGNVLEMQSSDSKVARIDKTGKGFFNGGTQSSGADVAEMFDVEGERNNYEPGDVLVISEKSDRAMNKSFEPNSTKVAGVYATKPGVTLTEKGVEENLDQLVPVGVIGVIPTKVCGENGPIKRGDLLVTSSKAGHAMKAISKNNDGVFPSGAILGKALENFDGEGTALIRVLVNVK